MYGILFALKKFASKLGTTKVQAGADGAEVKTCESPIKIKIPCKNTKNNVSRMSPLRHHTLCKFANKITKFLNLMSS